MIPALWPGAKLEEKMISDADIVWQNADEDRHAADLCCHVKAILTRVRELEDERLRLLNGLEMLAQVSTVCGSAQSTFWANLKITDALLAGADLRNLEVVEAIVAGTWRP